MEEIKEYTIMRINNYDINCDEYINDVYSIFYKAIEYKKTGNKVTIEIISKTNLTMDINNIKNFIRNYDKIDVINVIYKILDVFECEQNLYIVWEDNICNGVGGVTNGGVNKKVNGGTNGGVNGVISDEIIENIFKSLQQIFAFVVDNELLIDVIKYEDIHSDRIMIRPQKKRKSIVYGSPIYSPHYKLENKKYNRGVNDIEENLVINISILLYELIIKRINREFIYNRTEIYNSESIFSEFLLMLLDPNVNIKTKVNLIRNTQDIRNKNNGERKSKKSKNKSKSINKSESIDFSLDSEIFHLEL